MIKLINLIGARPQIIKAAAISRAINNYYSNQISEVIVHTGQHYDDNMSGHFFTQLNIPQPSYNLECGSLSHAKQTALIMSRMEDVLLKERPDYVLVYGDTNSTLAASVTAIKLGIPVAHIESGLRSFNKKMPEEINRIICDHSSTLLFCPTKTSIANLEREGFNSNTKPPYTADKPGIFHCGDVMFDNSIYYSQLASKHSSILEKLNIKAGEFILFTMHRDLNTDNQDRLTHILSALQTYTENATKQIIFPIHPRTRKMINLLPDKELILKFESNPQITICDPLDFFDITHLENKCCMIVTDSGGIQKEAFFFKKPCIVLRPETEWIELVESGNAFIADADQSKIVSTMTNYPNVNNLNYPAYYGDGHAAEIICKHIIDQHENTQSK